MYQSAGTDLTTVEFLYKVFSVFECFFCVIIDFLLIISKLVQKIVIKMQYIAGYTEKPNWDMEYVTTIAGNCNKQKYNAKR